MSDGVILKAEVEGARIKKLIDGAYAVTFANPSSLEKAKGDITSQLIQHILGSGTNSLSDDAVMSLAADDNLIGDNKGAELVSRETLRSGDVKAVREELFKSLEFIAHLHLEDGKKAEEEDFERRWRRAQQMKVSDKQSPPGTGFNFNKPKNKLTDADKKAQLAAKRASEFKGLETTAQAYAETSPSKEKAKAFAKALHDLLTGAKTPTPEITEEKNGKTFVVAAASKDQVVSSISSPNPAGIQISWASKTQGDPPIPPSDILWGELDQWLALWK